MTAISSDADELEHRQLSQPFCDCDNYPRPSRIRCRTRERQSHLLGAGCCPRGSRDIPGRSGGTAWGW